MDRALLRGRTKVPFLDLTPSNEPVREQVLEAFGRTINSGAFTNGPEVDQFESAFANYCGVRDCIGVASGLDALRLALMASELEPDSEVIVPALTFAATVEAVVQAGASPVLADISETDYNLDPVAAEAAVTQKTALLLPVHLFGQLADMAALERIADTHGLWMLEDACQAHGASREGRRAGNVGLAGAFSFYPAKNLGAFGDAGALVTNDGLLAKRVRALREHGEVRKYEHAFEGYTARLDTLQAIVLLHKLALLDRWNDQRRAAASLYNEALVDVGDVRLPAVPTGSDPVWHLYVIRTAQPERLARFLAERGIGTGRHYPQPIHRSQAFSRLGYPEGSFPVSEAVSAECLSLPIYPGMTEEQLTAVVESVGAYFNGG